MTHIVGALLFFGIVFLVTLGCLEVGVRVGRRALSGPDAHRPAGLGTVETVAFGVLGLLLAFTFSGAAARFDGRRAQVVEEANDIGTAWLRLDLLPAGPAAVARSFRRYVHRACSCTRSSPTLDIDAARAEHARPTRYRIRSGRAPSRHAARTRPDHDPHSPPSTR